MYQAMRIRFSIKYALCAIKILAEGNGELKQKVEQRIEDVKKKLKYDLLYVRKMCLWADFNIALRTFRAVLTGEGAR